MHTAGLHNVDKSAVWLSTYKYPKIPGKSEYALEYEYGRIFRERQAIVIMAIESPQASNPYMINLIYKLPNDAKTDAGRIKLMSIDMQKSDMT